MPFFTVTQHGPFRAAWLITLARNIGGVHLRSELSFLIFLQ